LTSNILPASLAAGELAGVSGRDVLTAFILGIEVAARLGRAARPLWAGAQRSGFLQATIIGGFGATAAAARLLDLDRAGVVNAFGLYHAQNSGNRQALYDKTLAKRIQPALAARNALWAVCLAADGVTGPANALEGSAGLARLYLAADGEIDATVLREGSGRWAVEELSVKRFTSCGGCHAVARAALELAERENFTPGDIADVAIYVGEGRNEMIDLPFEMGEHPQVNAQFCAAYGAAVALNRRRAGLREYTSEQIRADRETAELAARVRILDHLDEAARPTPDPRDPDDPALAVAPHVVFVTTADGLELSHHCSLAHELHPDAVTWDDVVAKLDECACFAGSPWPDRTGRIVAAVRSLRGAASLNELVSACSG